MYHNTYVMVRGDLVGVSPLFLPYVSLILNPDWQDWKQAPLSTICVFDIEPRSAGLEAGTSTCLGHLAGLH